MVIEQHNPVKSLRSIDISLSNGDGSPEVLLRLNSVDRDAASPLKPCSRREARLRKAVLNVNDCLQLLSEAAPDEEFIPLDAKIVSFYCIERG